MKEKALKINKKDYNIAKSLSDRDFGTLVRALCEYVYYGIDASPKDKILKVYYDNFKEKIDMENFFRETGRLGGIKSNELRQKAEENRSVVLPSCAATKRSSSFRLIQMPKIPRAATPGRAINRSLLWVCWSG